ncbi:winged helix-turn-helix transcriptional regulator [Mycobacterium sp.]|uniref:winged helix-turn-helix transcriptional regulator n=1 Tax=Mycobacterium sp. TaxID=1785 RepID=UPI003D0B5FA5
MTTARSYGQNCSLARAMDLLGERWAVLIVRELARGPKRFGDLLEGLHGIGTTMLAARLKRLESADVIARAEPGLGTGYHLTARGEQLAHALGELMLWGLDLPDMYQLGDQTRAVWLAMNMQSALNRATGNAPAGTHVPAGTYAFHVDDERFWLRVADDAPSVLRDGTPPYPADATLTLTRKDFYAVATGTALDALHDATVEGDRKRLAQLTGLLTLSPTR